MHAYMHTYIQAYAYSVNKSILRYLTYYLYVCMYVCMYRVFIYLQSGHAIDQVRFSLVFTAILQGSHIHIQNAEEGEYIVVVSAKCRCPVCKE
jgi:hypothetical protein